MSNHRTAIRTTVAGIALGLLALAPVGLARLADASAVATASPERDALIAEVTATTATTAPACERLFSHQDANDGSFDVWTEGLDGHGLDYSHGEWSILTDDEHREVVALSLTEDGAGWSPECGTARG